MRNLRTFSILVSPVACQASALAQSSGEAGRTLNNIESNDPQGFTWMLICIGIIVACALTLITITTVFALKGKKRT